MLLITLLLVSLTSGAADSSQYFSFHNPFLVNLHQTLYREGAVRRFIAAGRKTDTPLALDALSKEEKQAWERAVSYYENTFRGRREVFDPQLCAINEDLSRAQDLGSISDAQFPAELKRLLVEALPIYRKHWWPEHQKANQQWLNENKAMVDRIAGEVLPKLEKLFQTKLPMNRVELSYFVFEIGGAYTVNPPAPLTTFSTEREENHGLPGVETIFHENAHLLTDKLEHALDTECKAQKKDCGQLWHAVQFYTVGAVVRDALAAAGQKDYVPYADKYGLFTRGDWPKYRPIIVKDWQPWMDGKIGFDEAVRKMVGEL